MDAQINISAANSQVEAQIRALNESKKKGFGEVSNAARNLSRDALGQSVSNEMKLKAWKALEGVENWSKPGVISRLFFGAKDVDGRASFILEVQMMRNKFRDHLASALPGELDAVYQDLMANRKKVGGLAEEFFRSVPVSIENHELTPYKKLNPKERGFYNAIANLDVRTVQILLLDGICKTFTGKANLSRALDKAVTKLAGLRYGADELSPTDVENCWKIIDALVQAGAKPTPELKKLALEHKRAILTN